MGAIFLGLINKSSAITFGPGQKRSVIAWDYSMGALKNQNSGKIIIIIIIIIGLRIYEYDELVSAHQYRPSSSSNFFIYVKSYIRYSHQLLQVLLSALDLNWQGRYQMLSQEMSAHLDSLDSHIRKQVLLGL